MLQYPSISEAMIVSLLSYDYMRTSVNVNKSLALCLDMSLYVMMKEIRGRRLIDLLHLTMACNYLYFHHWQAIDVAFLHFIATIDPVDKCEYLYELMDFFQLRLDTYTQYRWFTIFRELGNLSFLYIVLKRLLSV